jgi:hypothetical protein
MADNDRASSAKVIQLPIRYEENIDRSRKVAEADPESKSPNNDGDLRY